MIMFYHYLGPPELRALSSPTRGRIQSAADVSSWAQQFGGAHDAIIATFIVNARGELWIADRRSEHVACAAGGPVSAAGEITFEAGEVVAVTNQSTGFCPQPESWSAVARALDEIGLAHPGAWTTRFDFRRCRGCGEINLVKESWFVCAVCDADLPREWNLSG